MMICALSSLPSSPRYRSPEPVHTAWPDATQDHLRRVATVSRVVLTGNGADPLFSSRISFTFANSFVAKRLIRALADAAGYLTAEGRLSRLYLRTRWRILFAPKERHFGFFPPWLSDDFAREFKLRERWETFGGPVPSLRPMLFVRRPTKSPSLLSGRTCSMHSMRELLACPCEVRHPFFDLRLMNYLLALPRLPWCCDKQLLREAAPGMLSRKPCACGASHPSLRIRYLSFWKCLRQPGSTASSRFLNFSATLTPSASRKRLKQKTLGTPWCILGHSA